MRRKTVKVAITTTKRSAHSVEIMIDNDERLVDFLNNDKQFIVVLLGGKPKIINKSDILEIGNLKD